MSKGNNVNEFWIKFNGLAWENGVASECSSWYERWERRFAVGRRNKRGRGVAMGEMNKLAVLQLILLGLFFCCNTAYAGCQIQFDGEADRVMHLGGNTLRGNFATKEQCLNYWRSRPPFEQNHSECVGCDEQDSSQTLQNDYSQPLQDWSSHNKQIRQQRLREEAERQEMIRQQKQREEQDRVRFEQGKKKILKHLKGGSGGEGLKLKGSGGTLALKSGNVQTDDPCAGREKELQQAKQRLAELNDDVEAMQFALELYRDGLLQNVSTLDQQANEIGDMSNKILSDGIKYLGSIASGRFLESKFKFMNKGQQKKYDDFIKLVEQIKKSKDEKEFLAWLVNSPNDTKKLIEGADILAEDVIPGWEHVKMNFKAWSTVGKECVAWLEINRLNRGTENYSQEIKAISLRMKTKVEKINSLKQCMAQSTAGCIQKCPK